MEQNKYTLVVNKKRIPVTKEVYKAYYQHREHEIYDDERYTNNTISLEDAEEKGISLEYIIASSQNSIEDEIIQNDMIARLQRCLMQLDEAERQLIRALFYLEKSERQLSAETGIHHMTIHNRKNRILSRLKKLLEK
ncbi:sigma-70 family RNA polymerase sigma factor [Clostridium sp. BNL1100]|uniref:sigma-70 family RNA polymerase sigma factor n=1 Tax=Clostridium sp. BNL1100 TaxID=755731 RepID=UPI00024A7E69|nr:sigma-70 family RNA polymerase sigma factor [Clostridium sp. BNL1100]AEY67549.1 DNA-directed RNA polymerase specialized sigma subunit, sigma24 [Clostridium sp. BNL1100]